MTYDKDPTRWSEAGNADVPDMLRDLMQAGAQEAPSAAKLAVLGGKVTATAGAVGVAASMAGATKLWLAGLAISVAVVGGAALNAGRAPSARLATTEAPRQQPQVTAVAPSDMGAPIVEELPVAEVTPTGTAAPATAPVTEAEDDGTSRSAAPEALPSSVGTPTTAGQLGSKRAPRRARAPRATSGTAAGTQDVQLLQRARRALSSQPGRALALARMHAKDFPESQFAQERDALVIEALTRTGQLERARSEARLFVEHYPSSAHAHRFRERLGL